MKLVLKIALAGILFLAATLSLNAQTLKPFPQPGLIQAEVRRGDFSSPGEFNATFRYMHDTLISNLRYSLFINTDYRNNLFYTRYDSGKVYLSYPDINMNPLNERLHYDFSLGLGDTFNAIGWAMGKLVVDSVSSIQLLNGEVRKWMRLRVLNPVGTLYHYWVDGIGDIENGFFYYSDFEGGQEYFVCHQDSSGIVYKNIKSYWDCDSLILGPEVILTSPGYVCYGHRVDLQYQISRIDQKMVKWSTMGDGIFDNSDNPRSYTPGPSDVNTGFVNLKVFTIKNGKVITLAVFTIYIDKPPITILQKTTEGCLPLVASYSISSDSSNLKYYWNFGDSSSGGNNFDSLKSQANHTFTQKGKYIISILSKSPRGCTNEETIAVEVHPIPHVELPADTNFCPDVSHFFIDVAQPQSIYEWENGLNVSVRQIIAPGLYHVKLTDTNTGCYALDSMLVNLDCEPVLYIPGGFSPNDDGLNDRFNITASNILKYHIDVYTTNTTETLFSSDDINQSWDGFYKNKPVQDGSYMYVIRYVSPKDKIERIIAGKVFILR